MDASLSHHNGRPTSAKAIDREQTVTTVAAVDVTANCFCGAVDVREVARGGLSDHPPKQLAVALQLLKHWSGHNGH